MNSICTQSETPKENISFVKEIQMMMFGLGDSPTPLLTTASVIEEIVLRQLVSIVIQAEEIAENRGVDGIFPQDILFIMRKDVHKLKRMISYIGFKEMKKNLTSSLNEGDISSLEDLLPSSTDMNKSKRKDICMQFLLSIGINLDEETSVDAVKQERLRMADLRTQVMSQKSFEEYNISRRATFQGARLNSGRFMDWLRHLVPDCPVHKLKTFTVEMLLYLAKETVAQLVDQALLLRRDASVSPLDPYSRAQRTTLPFETFGSSQRQLEGSPPITPSEVREVLRRYYSTHLHPWGTFTCNLDTAVFNKILAC